MVSSDPTKDYLARTMLEFFATSSASRSKLVGTVEDMQNKLCESQEVASFLDGSSREPLQAALTNSDAYGLDIELSNRIHPLKEATAYMYFFKTGNDEVTVENIHRTVSMLSMQDSAVDGLYHLLHSVFLPLLVKDGIMDETLQDLVRNLEAGLSKLSMSGSQNERANINDVVGILTLENEVDFWRGAGRDLDGAQGYLEQIKEIAYSFDEGEEGDDVVTKLEDVVRAKLEDLWKDQYPQKRMTHLLKLIGDAVTRSIQKKMNACGIWTAPFVQAERELSQANEALKKWTDTTKELTGQFWKEDDGDGARWRGEEFRDEKIQGLKQRVQKIMEIRTTHDALQGLLTPDEEKALQLGTAFKKFEEVKALYINPYSDAIWNQALSDYDNLMAPAEAKVCEKLRELLISQVIPSLSHSVENSGRKAKGDSSKVAQPYQVLKQLFKFRELLGRPAVAKKLGDQLEMVGKLLGNYFDAVSQNMSGASAPEGEAGKNLAGVVPSIAYTTQLMRKVEQLAEAARPLLVDVSGFRDVDDRAKALLKELKLNRASDFEQWKETVADSKDETGLDMHGKLMSFNKADGRLHVHYSERLVTLIRECRQLCALGLEIPRDIEKIVSTAQKYFHSATVLKQVAAFYNTIDGQIINCQQPMLIEEAVSFESIVKNDGKNITWSDTNQLQQYTVKLQEAMRKLTEKNRRLRKAHDTIGELVVRLMNTDLVRQRDKWKDGLQEVRRIIEDTTRNDKDPKFSEPWKLHWDHQLCKALEYQYKLGLECCHETLPQVEAKLVFKQKKLCFEPPYEELRQTYYKELRKFIQIPMLFRGVGDAEIFKTITDRNSEGLHVVFQQAEKLFQKLADVQERLTHWVALGSVDLDEVVEQALKEVEDWESNFRILKTRGRDAEKLSDFDKVDCINVDKTGVKEAVDNQLKDFNRVLCSTLRKSAEADREKVDEFVKESLEALKVMPQSMEEFAEVTTRWGKVKDESGAIRDLKMQMEEKGRLLKLQAGSVLDTTELNRAWDDLELRLSAHEKNVEEQKGKIREDVMKRVSGFSTDLTKFQSKWKALKPDDSSLSNWAEAEKTVGQVRELETEFKEKKAFYDDIMRNCRHFDVPEPSFPELEGLEEDINKTVGSMDLFAEFSGEMTTMGDEKWLEVRERLYVVEDFLAKWSERLKGLEVGPVVRFLYTRIESLKVNTPFLKFIKGDGFTQDHWSTLFGILRLPQGIKLRDLTLQLLLEASQLVVDNLAEIKNLQARASAELTIQEAFDELTRWAIDAEFTIIEQKDSGDRSIALIKEWKEVQTQVGDHQSVLQAAKDSPYFVKFKGQAEDWENKLAVLGVGLDELNQVQRKWLYLEPIFGRGALPEQQSRFKRVDDDFRNIMDDIQRNKRVIAFADFSNIIERLTQMMDQLERCQTALSDFLEEKRSKFPRFYFIGDDDLLEILGQAKTPSVIQAHLKKLFQAIFAVEFSDDFKEIVGFRSIEGEKVALLQPVAVTDTVEDWLKELGTGMVQTLEKSLTDCLQTFDLEKFPSMILCAAEQVWFCRDTEEALRSRQVGAIEKKLRDKLSKFTSFGQVEDTVFPLKLKAIILDIIHDIDVLNQLKQNQVNSTKEWYWHKQLRYYHEDGKCVLRMCDAENKYTYEYQGNDPKLVHTPLTDKCYLTLTQGLHLGYGGNPYGPAGTGKTESVKALGQALARQVLVFNCDEGIDFKSMGRIFTGLVKCGAWGCFDEFNRLEPEVLSAVSQQIQTIQAALKEKRSELNLLGKVIEVNANSGIFVTLNPAGKGYGGRSELPDNLKQLFRSVAMSAPDNALIAEVILYAEGYKHANIVGTKVVELFTLSKQLLSKQQHYDWGLRALKTILLISGKLVMMEKKTNDAIELKTEMELVIKAVRLNTLAKLTFMDTQRFEALIKDIFPGTEVMDAVYEDLETAIQASLEELKLDNLPSQVKKVVQLNENLNQRMGCVIVGPSGSGKSALLRILRAALDKMGQKVVVHTMNPKAMPRQQLLGHMDMDTREWFDGVLTASARQVVKEPENVRSWIICDGDIDPEWVESLNSVLDDNRLLTMPSGERIRFGPNVNFIFETNDLRFASPATVSRMGMIFLSDEDMRVSCLVKAWISRQPEGMQQSLTKWLDEVFDKGLEWVLTRTKSVVDTTKCGVVLNALSHLVGCESKEQFAVALIRGLGSNLEAAARKKLAGELFNWTGERPVTSEKPLDTYYDAEKKMLKEYTADLSQELTGSQMVDQDLPVVTTVDLLKNSDLFLTWLDNMEPFLLVGPEGCGKSMLLRHAFAKRSKMEIATINCNAQTSETDVIKKLQQACAVATTSSGRVYRPKAERLVLYLKDINLPKPDKYDTMQLIAFLQQMILYKGFYDNLEWMGVERVQIVCSMNPSGTVGRHNLTTRFTAILRIASISYPDRDQLQQVYSEYLKAVLKSRLPSGSDWSDNKQIEKLAGGLLDFYENLRKRFTVDHYRHYLFTPRDITSLVVGLMRYNLTGDNKIEPLDVLTHEAQRIFRDRLVGEDSIRSFDLEVWGQLLRSWSGHKPDLKDCFFTTWLYSDDQVKDIRMLGRSTADDLLSHVEDEKKKYEREFKELNILLFPEIVDRIARLDRVLSQPGGSLLLIGRPGVGRRTCVTLACYMHQMEWFSAKVTRGYTSKNFLNDLKDAVKLAGVEGQPAALFLEDYQLVENSFLEIINSLLSSGEVPGMFNNQELDAMLGPLKEEYSREGFKYRTLYAFFVARVQRNLHIILSLDPTHPEFLLRCESNPALYTKCNIMWLEAWTQHGMTEVPKNRLKETLQENLPEEQDGDHLVKQMIYLHNTSVERGGAPRNFMTLIDTIDSLYTKRREELIKQQKFLQSGLQKLRESSEVVDKLSSEAVEAERLLKEKQKQAQEKMKEIKANLEGAAHDKQRAEVLSRELEGKEEEIQESRVQVEQELADCKPILEHAKKAVGSIRKDNLNELKSLKMPPEQIRDVLEGVLRLMGNQDTSWISMKRFLSQPSVIQEIINYDANNVTKEMREAVGKLLQSKGASFNPENIQRVSVAAAPMAAWVQAQLKYSLVLEKIKPLTVKLESLDKNLDAARREKEGCETKIAESDAIVARLEGEYQTLQTDVVELTQGLKKVASTLQSANELVGKLKDENERWGEQDRDLGNELKKLPLTMLMAASFITYLGGTPEDLRAGEVEKWSKELGLTKFNFMQMMSTETERLKWKGQGLPGDDLSAENAIVILNSLQYPLIIDPSTQATDWLLRYLADQEKPIESTTQQDPKFLQKLELSVRFGKTLVIKEVDYIEPVMLPLLRKDLSLQGARKVVQIGEKVIDFNENFKLYMVTRNPQIEIQPDARPLIAEVNFSVTRSGLEGQLLGITIQREKPALEQQKSQLLQEEEEKKMELSDLEKKLLEELASSGGNILENKPLIEQLTEIKASSLKIKDALAKSHELQLNLDEERNVYRPFAETASNVYFLIQGLKSVNYMYQFDLPTYLLLFNNTLNNSPSSQQSVEDRIRTLISTLKKNIFTMVGRSLFKADRLTFGMHLVRGMHPEGMEQGEWDFFVGLIVADTTKSKNTFPDWIPQDRLPAVQRLAATMPLLVQSLGFQDDGPWRDWLATPKAEMPNDFPRKAATLRPFQKMMVVQALRPDRLQSAMEMYVYDALGIRSVNLGTLDLGVIAKDTLPQTPIMFIVTPGADPSAILEQACDQKLGPGKYRQLAMGQGQSEAAIKLLHESAENGLWLCLQNVHLVVNWLPKLEKELLNTEENPSFHLWLTTEPHPRFPPILLQRSVKVTFEAPPGLKKNMQNAFSMWGPQTFQGAKSKGQLLFVVAWFHAVVQERRTFIPQGWSKFHEFSYADLRSTADIITSFDSEVPPWETLHGLLDNAIYGGRIDNIFDQRILRTCLKTYYRIDNVSIGGRPARPLPNSKGFGPKGDAVTVPDSQQHSEFLTLINQMPDVDQPSLFGLPSNIERVIQQANSNRITSQLKTMATAAVAEGGWDRDRVAGQLQPLLQLWQTLTTGTSALKQGKGEAGKRAGAMPVDNFVAMEAEVAHGVVLMVNAALEAVNRVLRGTDLLTVPVRNIATTLAAGIVPEPWSDKWEGPESPPIWLQAVVKKKLAIDQWLETVERGETLSSPVYPNSMFNPSVFLNALRQQTARQSKVAVDELKLVCQWGDSARSGVGALPCTISGFVLQGALASSGTLSEAKPDTPTVVPLPNCTVSYIPQNQDDPLPSSSSVVLPVYEGLDRSKLLTQLSMPCRPDEQDKWIMCGAAIFVSAE